MKAVDRILLFQGVYYLLTSLWPLIHLPSFERVVGSKSDTFQLYTTSFLIFVIAITLLLSIGEKKTKAIWFLALSSSFAFLIVELWYWGRIRPVFLIDGIIEFLLVIFLILLLIKRTETPAE